MFAARAVNAIYRMDGLWLPVDVMHAPSVTNTFGQPKEKAAAQIKSDAANKK